MAVFKIKYQEVLEKEISIEAENPTEALHYAWEKYRACEIVLDADDFNGSPSISVCSNEEYPVMQDFCIHLERIIDYLEYDEEKDYSALDDSTENHIYLSVLKMKSLLSELKKQQ